MKKASLCLFIILLFALTLRLYPTLISNMPFSTDAWPLIRNTELIIQNTPIPLNNALFDAYNNFWPAIQLFGAALSQITNLPPIIAMAIGIPIAAALAIPIFYVLVKKLTENTTVALVASLMLAAAFSYTLYTSGVTKEAFASPIYITLILLFLLKHNKKTVLLFSIASAALALTHHFTAFFATIILVAISIANYFGKNDEKQENSNLSNLSFTAIQATITISYFVLFASPKFNSNFSSSMLLTVAAYQILFASLTLGMTYSIKKASTKRSLMYFIIGSSTAIWAMYTILHTCTLPGAHLLYELPLFIGLPLAVFGLIELYQRKTKLTAPFFWLISVLAFTFFAVFSNIGGASDFTWRSMNFILPPLIILIAIGISKLYSTPPHVKLQKLTKPLSILLVLAIVSANAYGMYKTVSEQDSSLGYFWLYRPSDFEASKWIASYANNQTTAGDARVDYLLHQYFNKSVSTSQGLRYLEGNGTAPEILYIYDQMKEESKGYVIAGVPISLPANWTEKLSNYNLIYANNEVTIYAKR
jgi:hypothetical protein